MLPADVIAEITTNLAALPLESNLAAQVLAAVFAPLMRSGVPEQEDLQDKPTRKRTYARRRPGRARSRRTKQRRKYKRHAPTEARDRALAALRENPNASVTDIAKVAKVSRSTVSNAAKILAQEARKAVRREARRKPRKTANTATPDPKTERRSRAQRFLRETLAQGPKEVQAIEAAAAKAHIDDVLLSQARADLGVIATRANTGGSHAVQWSLPG